MQFAYTAKTSTGDIQTGLITSADVESVKRALREQSLFPIDIRKSDSGSIWKSLFGARQHAKLSGRDLLSVTTQLAIMTRSGVDLASAFESLSQQSRSPNLRQVLLHVHKDLTGGKSVSDSMRAQAAVFGDAYVASVAAGEAAGKVPEVLGRLAQLQRTEMRVRSSIRALLAYPVLLTGVSSLVILGLVCFVLPQFQGIFNQFDMDLPILTQWIVASSDMLRNFVWLWLPIAGMAAFGLVAAKHSDAGRWWWDSAMLNTVIIRDITRRLLRGLEGPVDESRAAAILELYGVRHEKGIAATPGPRGVFRPLAIPTALLVDERGIVRWIDQTDDYRIRSDANRVLAAIAETLGAPRSVH